MDSRRLIRRERSPTLEPASRRWRPRSPATPPRARTPKAAGNKDAEEETAAEAPSKKRRTVRRKASKWDRQSPPASGWDCLAMQEVLAKQRSDAPGNVPKKRKELYVGNLAQGVVDTDVLRNALETLFKALPSYMEAYPDLEGPLRSVAFPPGQQGMFAFVEFYDEVLASTAILFSGFELHGRPVKLGRPQGYVPPPYGESPPLDVEPLRKSGVLPSKPDIIVVGQRHGAATKRREVYFGNLLTNKVTEEVMTELLTPVCLEMPDFNPLHGPPISKVTMAATGVYCFVTFQSESLAATAIPVFNGMELFGRRLKVGKPAGCPEEPLPPPTGPLPPPPPPPPLSDLAAEGAAAAAAFKPHDLLL